MGEPKPAETYPAAVLTVLCRVPTPLISISTTSPSDRNSGGTRVEPNPEGVPVAMTSPGDSGVKVEK